MIVNKTRLYKTLVLRVRYKGESLPRKITSIIIVYNKLDSYTNVLLVVS
jgi:hypothetical protein